MTKAKALKIMLQIVKECEKHDSDNNGGCRECAFGYGIHCLVSDGKDIPSQWRINKKIYEWMEGSDI